MTIAHAISNAFYLTFAEGTVIRSTVKYLSSLTQRQANIPYGEHIISVCESMAKTKELLLFSSIFFAENLFKYVQKSDLYIKNVASIDSYSLSQGAIFAGSAAVAALGWNYFNSNSPASVTGTMVIAALTPFVHKGISKILDRLSKLEDPKAKQIK